MSIYPLFKEIIVKKWEVRWVPIPDKDPGTKQQALQLANTLGQEGWELVQIIMRGFLLDALVMKREIPDKTIFRPATNADEVRQNLRVVSETRQSLKERGLPDSLFDVLVELGLANPKPPAENGGVRMVPEFTDPSGHPERRSPDQMGSDEFIRQGRD